jgi:hypothetical protein
VGWRAEPDVEDDEAWTPAAVWKRTVSLGIHDANIDQGWFLSYSVDLARLPSFSGGQAARNVQTRSEEKALPMMYQAPAIERLGISI